MTYIEDINVKENKEEHPEVTGFYERYRDGKLLPRKGFDKISSFNSNENHISHDALELMCEGTKSDVFGVSLSEYFLNRKEDLNEAGRFDYKPSSDDKGLAREI